MVMTERDKEKRDGFLDTMDMYMELKDKDEPSGEVNK